MTSENSNKKAAIRKPPQEAAESQKQTQLPVQLPAHSANCADQARAD